ncbi:hypothetical protein O6H91_09G078500 [Diphasiastrum complanatum]|uniref:Uncharacterized protein n=1 Tax=Diphasiastrum complanatum TaxID=34168 RepID=A0ACC2CR64_DIPCM|nr:hypothetical protein O6H91_09G078500 [Diphasiastrum complanatum]
MICTVPGSCACTPSKLQRNSTSNVLRGSHSKSSASQWKGNNVAAQGTLNENKAKLQPIFQEKIGSKLIRRYLINKDSNNLLVKDIDASHTQINEATDVGKLVRLKDPIFSITLPQPFVDFILPAGFPGSVSDDYLDYMIWQFPTNVTGWICSTLITSSLLKAVGITAGTGSVAAATAAIKWVTKDGLGALGRLFIGGQFGSLFDEDPKQWRMYADLIGSGGGIFELATPLAPDHFLILASLGNLTKAIAKGLKDPSFRVIQNHFARMENVGDVAAKEEVWEVAGQLLGLSLGVSILATPGVATSYPNLVMSWATIRVLHLWLRYQSLSVLNLATINYKRASLLIQSHVRGVPIPGRIACNNAENLLLPWQLKKPRIRVGCSFQDLVGPHLLASEVVRLIDIYKNEQYILAICPDGLHGFEACVVFKEGATSITVLQSMWQAYWLLLPEHSKKLQELIQSMLSPADKPVGSIFEEQKNSLITSLCEMKERFDSFLCELDEVGWDLSKLVVKIPSEAPILCDSR